MSYADFVVWAGEGGGGYNSSTVEPHTRSKSPHIVLSNVHKTSISCQMKQQLNSIELKLSAIYLFANHSAVVSRSETPFAALA